MRISVIAVGRLRPLPGRRRALPQALAGHARIELVEVREDEKVPPRIPARAFTVLLASNGRSLDSVEFSRWLEERRQAGLDLCFVIGGPRGLEMEVDMRLSLGPMTLRTSWHEWCCSSSSTAVTRSSRASRITIN